MADRRMFSKRIINSGRFLKMPISTQALYFHLGLNADDDGIVEAYNVLNSTGASEDDLRILVAKGYVYVLNEDLVTYIMDWTENNKIRADRKIDSVYKDLLVQIIPDVKLVEKRQRADRLKPYNNGTSQGQPKDGIGQDRIGEGSLVEDNANAEPPPSYQQVVDMYLNICKSYPRLRTMPDSRKETIEERLKEYGIDVLKEVFVKAEDSVWLKSKNFGLDWLLKEDNMAKVLEGNYDNKPQAAKGRTEPTPKWMAKEKQSYDFDALENELQANKPDLSERVEKLRKRIGTGV